MAWTPAESIDRVRAYRHRDATEGLSGRAGKVLYWALESDAPTTPELVQERYPTRSGLISAMLRERNCGIGTAHEIADWAGVTA